MGARRTTVAFFETRKVLCEGQGMGQVRLKARTVSVATLTQDTKDELFSLMQKYYAHTTKAQFEMDLANKDHIILLQNSPDSPILGFSTLQKLTFSLDGRTVMGVFSGDTVIDQSCWGQGSLGVAFLKYLFWNRLRAPFSPLYWFLISKGYKTYLLMANNFPKHYPRFEGSTPHHAQRIMNHFAVSLFGDCYDRKNGLVVYPDVSSHIKAGIASIDEKLVKENPRVQFFTERNPQWHEGHELVCLAEMTWLMPLHYWLKKQRQRFSRVLSTMKQETGDTNIKQCKS